MVVAQHFECTKSHKIIHFKKMTAEFYILWNLPAWKIPWTEEPGPWGCWESDTTERLHFHFSLSCMGEGNGNPLQSSCLENPRDGEPGGLLSGVAQSRTRLKRLSSSSGGNLPKLKKNKKLSRWFSIITKAETHWLKYWF